MTCEQIGFASSAWLATRNGTLAVCAALCVLGTAVSADANATYTTFDPPGSTSTQANSINDQGVITGSYLPCGGSVSGSFVRAADGSITTFSVFPCTGQEAKETSAESVNYKGAITGNTYAGFSYGGFVRKADGRIKLFDCINLQNNYSFTRPVSINDKGAATGFCNGGNARDQGFVRAPDGKLVIFSPPESTGTYAVSINDSGVITGYYEDANGMQHAFVRSADGTITSFDPSGSIGTRAVAINSKGAIAGYYNDSNGIDHGFVRAADGTITTFTAFGTTQMTPMSINSGGAITGSYTESNTFHGFVRAPDGTIRSFDPPGSFLTYPLAINGKGAITGYYEDRKGTHGFLRTK